MALDALQVEALQDAQPPTDWSRFDNNATGLQEQQFGPGGLPPGMGSPWDDKLHVRFFIQALLNVEMSTKENRPIYEDIPFVEIMIPGDKNNIVVKRVDDLDKRRFPSHWKQFLDGVKDQLVGTPLKVAPFISPAIAEELMYYKIRTIEQLASMPDSNLTFMGARELKTQAQAYIDKAKGADALMARIEALEKAAKDAEAARLKAEAELEQVTRPRGKHA